MKKLLLLAACSLSCTTAFAQETPNTNAMQIPVPLVPVPVDQQGDTSTPPPDESFLEDEKVQELEKKIIDMNMLEDLKLERPGEDASPEEIKAYQEKMRQKALPMLETMLSYSKAALAHPSMQTAIVMYGQSLAGGYVQRVDPEKTIELIMNTAIQQLAADYNIEVTQEELTAEIKKMRAPLEEPTKKFEVLIAEKVKILEDPLLSLEDTQRISDEINQLQTVVEQLKSVDIFSPGMKSKFELGTGIAASQNVRDRKLFAKIAEQNNLDADELYHFKGKKKPLKIYRAILSMEMDRGNISFPQEWAKTKIFDYLNQQIGGSSPGGLRVQYPKVLTR